MSGVSVGSDAGGWSKCLVYVRYGTISPPLSRGRVKCNVHSLVKCNYIFTMDTQSILRTAIAEHEDSQSNGITLESLTAEAEASLKDLESVCASK